MEIDEDRDVLQISDHNLITVEFDGRRKNNYRFKNSKMEGVNYYRKDRETLESFGDEVERLWRNRDINSIEEMTVSMIEVADVLLKKEYKRKISGEGKWHKVEAPWMNEEIRRGIKERKNINRKRRNCKCDKGKKILEQKYKEQKEKV